MATEQGHDAATAGGESKPVVLPYESPGSRAPDYGGWPNGLKVGLVTGALFVVASCANDPHTAHLAIFVLVLGAVLWVGVRMMEDGHGPEWLVGAVALLAGVAMVAIGMQAAAVAADPGHPLPRWRPGVFRPSLVIVVVVSLAGAVAGYYRSKGRSGDT